MIICHCNNIRTCDVQRAVENGHSTLKDCCTHLEMDIQCATCLDKIKEEIGDEWYSRRLKPRYRYRDI